MIQIVLDRTQSGNLYSCTAEGHAGFAKKGQDIVCAAVTVLLRTTLSILESTSGIVVETDIPTRGMLAFRVWAQCSDNDIVNIKTSDTPSSLLTYAGDFLQEGLRSLQTEYPEQVSLQINILEKH